MQDRTIAVRHCWRVLQSDRAQHTVLIAQSTLRPPQEAIVRTELAMPLFQDIDAVLLLRATLSRGHPVLLPILLTLILDTILAVLGSVDGPGSTALPTGLLRLGMPGVGSVPRSLRLVQPCGLARPGGTRAALTATQLRQCVIRWCDVAEFLDYAVIAILDDVALGTRSVSRPAFRVWKRVYIAGVHIAGIYRRSNTCRPEGSASYREGIVCCEVLAASR